jgi:hypothetical protein
MYKMMYSIKDMNNGTLNAIKAMPQKDSTSDNNSSFEMGRRTYAKTLPNLTQQAPQNLEKKWSGNRDASQVAANRRNKAIGVGSLNAKNVPTSFTTHKVVNTVNDAIRRVRAGGAVAPPKKNAMRTNGLTPTFAPAIPKNNIIGLKYNVLYN